MPKTADIIRKLERKAHSSKHGPEREALFAKAHALRAQHDIGQHTLDRPAEGLSMGQSTRSKLEAALRAAMVRPNISEKDRRAAIEMLDNLVLGRTPNLFEFRRLTLLK